MPFRGPINAEIAAIADDIRRAVSPIDVLDLIVRHGPAILDASGHPWRAEAGLEELEAGLEELEDEVEFQRGTISALQDEVDALTLEIKRLRGVNKVGPARN
jgi:hypothetical protein